MLGYRFEPSPALTKKQRKKESERERRGGREGEGIITNAILTSV
jgi:hypothetical protein